MSEHTPGPWVIISEPAKNRIDRLIQGADQRTIAMVYGPEPTLPREANARLIAAAPELLEAIEEALEVLELYDEAEMRDKMYTAIAKAKGTS